MFAPVAYDDQDIEAMRAFRAGQASQEQQQRVWQFIEFASYLGLNTYVDGQSQRDSDFLSGRQYVGQMMHRLVHVAIRDQRGLR